MKILSSCLRVGWIPCLLTFFGPLGPTGLLAQSGTGYIQITAEPGVQVFLDGVPKGVSSADQGGLILTGVAPGKHQLKVSKEEFQPQEVTVTVEAGKVLEHKVQPFAPMLEIVQRGSSARPQTGSLLIQSLPVGCKITMGALGVSGQEKEQDEMEFGKVPAGTYSATFSALGKSVSHTFEITAGRRTHLFVNILENKVQEANTEVHIQPAAPIATTGGGTNRSIPDLGLALIWIGPGTFQMGTASGGDDDERPATQVAISAGYWLGQTEVTQAQWQTVMGGNPSKFKGDNRPVEQVSWGDAMDFCRKLTERERGAGRLSGDLAYTLPTEAQWEYACRAGTLGDYAGSLDALGWYAGNSGNQTHPAGQKQANAWGLFDMHGNVWEWCADWYGDYPGGSVSDPTGKASGTDRVYRGGSWGNGAVSCRSVDRYGSGPAGRWDLLGFRIALSAARQ